MFCVVVVVIVFKNPVGLSLSLFFSPSDFGYNGSVFVFLFF